MVGLWFGSVGLVFCLDFYLLCRSLLLCFEVLVLCICVCLVVCGFDRFWLFTGGFGTFVHYAWYLAFWTFSWVRV